MKKKTKGPGPAAWLRENKWTCVVLAAALAVLLAARLLAAPARVETDEPENRADYESAVVDQVLSDSTEKDPASDNGYRGEQLLLVTVRSGDYKGQQMQVYNYVGPLYGGPLKVGDRATVLISTYSDGTVNATVYEFDRLLPLCIVLVLFIAAAVAVGGRTGVKSLVALAVTLVCLFGVLLPPLMKGANTLLMTFIVCAYVAVVSLTIVGGVRKKTVCAMLGAVAGTALALLFGLLASVPAFAQKTYVNGIDSNYPPFAYVDEKTGQPAGFDVDAMNWIAKTMGFKVVHKPVAWDGIVLALANKQIDMIASGMSITEKRRKVVDFSDPYWEVSRVFLVPADSKLTPADILSKPIKLGVQRGTSEAEAIKQEQKEKGYPFELRFYESCPLAVEDLVNGRIEAALMDSLPAGDAIARGKAVKKAGVHGEPDQFGVAIRKGDKELRALIDEGFRKLQADPYWKELQAKYLSK